MELAARPRVNLWVDPRSLHPRPSSPVRQHTLRPAGLPPLDALVATPAAPVGVLLYSPGFGPPLGPWEIAKCAHLADATSLADLKDAKLGAALGTTSLDYIEEYIQPTTQPQVFDDNAAAKAAFSARKP